jgi:hypothetical protein
MSMVDWETRTARALVRRHTSSPITVAIAAVADALRKAGRKGERRGIEAALRSVRVTMRRNGAGENG